MPLQLNFRVEDRGGVMVIITQGKEGTDDAVRPASVVEVELWNALTRRIAMPTRESYLRVNEQDLVAVLMERDQLRRQVTDLNKKLREAVADNATAQERVSHERIVTQQRAVLPDPQGAQDAPRDDLNAT